MLGTEIEFAFYEICNRGRATVEAEPAIDLAKKYNEDNKDAE